MSVLIKGMRMPEKGFVDVRLFADGRATTQSGESPYYKEMDVVEIPEPHGRLIDADAYCEDLLEEAHRVWGLLKPETIERINRTVDDLKNYPTIIEAEGRKDGESHDES